MGYECFTWRGEPIHDIKAWAAKRNERMVKYHAERWVPGFHSAMVKEEYDGEMPQSFWDTLAITGGWSYHELSPDL